MKAADITEIGNAAYMIKPIKKMELYKGIKELINKRNEIQIRRDLKEVELANINEESTKDEDEKDIHSCETVSSKTKILVAEDNEMNLLGITKILEKYGYTTLKAYNGKDAVFLAEMNKDISLVLMDIQMPEMNGLEAMKKIKERKLLDVPIVAVTAYATKEEMKKFMEEGFDDYLSKPIGHEKLISLVKKILKASPNV